MIPLTDRQAASRVLEEAVALLYARTGSADGLARDLGVSNRTGLNRLFRRMGASNLRTQLGWVRVIDWVRCWEGESRSLCYQNLRAGTDPAWAYRLVRRVTGQPWSEVCRLGSEWVIGQLIARRPPRKSRVVTP